MTSELEVLKQLAQRFGVVKIEHNADIPGQYLVAVKRDENEDDLDDYDGFVGIGVGASLEQAIEDAHKSADFV